MITFEFTDYICPAKYLNLRIGRSDHYFAHVTRTVLKNEPSSHILIVHECISMYEIVMKIQPEIQLSCCQATFSSP